MMRHAQDFIGSYNPHTDGILSVRLSTPGRRPKNSGFDVAEGRF
jgi:hypothetical protein